MIEVIIWFIFGLVVIAGTWIVLRAYDVSLPRIRAVKPESPSATIQRVADEQLTLRHSRMKERRREEVRAEKRLEERHATRAADLLEFDYRMEALLPHTEHTEKTRLSPRTGCYECEQNRKQDQVEHEWNGFGY